MATTLIIADDFSIHRKGCADINRNCGGQMNELGTFDFTTWKEFASWYSAYWEEETNEKITPEEFLEAWNNLGDKKPCTGLK